MAWHNATGRPYPLPQELIQHLEYELAQERQRAEQERQRAEQMEQILEQERAEKLRLMERLRQLEGNDE